MMPGLTWREELAALGRRIAADLSRYLTLLLAPDERPDSPVLGAREIWPLLARATQDPRMLDFAVVRATGDGGAIDLVVSARNGNVVAQTFVGFYAPRALRGRSEVVGLQQRAQAAQVGVGAWYDPFGVIDKLKGRVAEPLRQKLAAELRAAYEKEIGPRVQQQARGAVTPVVVGGVVVAVTAAAAIAYYVARRRSGRRRR